MSTAEYFEDINDDIVGANEKTSMTHQPKPEVKCGNCGKPFERTGDHLSVVTQEYVCSPASTKVKCPKQGTLTPCSKDCPASPASTKVKCEHTKGFKCNLCRDTQIANNDFKSFPASTEVKCKNRYCASNTAFSQFGCTCPSPASTEVKVTPCKGNFRTCGGKCDICVGLLSFSASTEEWRSELQKIAGYKRNGERVPFSEADFLLRKDIENLLSSHDQQLRQRIVEWLDSNESAAIMKEDIKTFITNLK